MGDIAASLSLIKRSFIDNSTSAHKVRDNRPISLSKTLLINQSLIPRKPMSF